MKKAFGQTVREIKREVNKKVLKVPGIEQKILDATSNEPWGPHGSSLADIAQASRNYHEYQMIMSVIWKRINDTGKNWRHVYKALTVLEYLVAHGSERVIDEIREHAYQISTLSDFQYIDSSGRDQGSNVRKKSQSLVALVNDKERIQEVRQKAVANRDKFRNMSSTGGMYRPSSYSSAGGYGDRYEDDRYGNRDDDRNGYGNERSREWGNRDDDRYGRGGDSYSRDGDRYGRDTDDRYGRDGHRDDDYRGRSRSNDDYQYGSRSRSSDRYRDRTYEDDGYSSRSSGAKADDHYQDERRLERKFSEQNLGAPPSYEEVISSARNTVQDERDGEPSSESVPKASSAHGSANPIQETLHETSAPPAKQVDGFDEFDPRGAVGSVSAAPPPTVNSTEMDLLGSLSESFSSNSLALVPVSSATTTTEADGPINSASGPTFAALPSASTVINQPIEDPFGESPFKATPSQDNIAQPQDAAASMTSFPPAQNHISTPHPAAPKMETVSSFDFGDSFSGMPNASSSISNVQLPSVTLHNLPPEPSSAHQTDILAGILPPSGSSMTAAFSAPTGAPAQPSDNFVGSFLPQTGYAVSATSQAAFSAPAGQPAQPSSNLYGSFPPQMGSVAPTASQVTLQTPAGPAAQTSSNALGNYLPQGASTAPSTSQPAPAPTGPSANAQPQKDKFEPKSAVWADTLSRGLVNLNISGPKINPLADIGIDFDSINRMEKRKEKPSVAPVTSTVNMGKAMGSGSGIGRAGAGALRPPPTPMIGSSMGMAVGGGAGAGMGMGMVGGAGAGMGMGMGGAVGVGMGGYGGLSQQPMGMGMGMGMNMGMGQGVQMRPTGLPPAQPMPTGYNPMMGAGGYAPQQQYGGYR